MTAPGGASPRRGRLSLLDRLTRHWGSLGAAGYAAILCLAVLGTVGAVGILSRMPWLFPSLGPTVMLFFESPNEKASRPLNALVGHGVGIGLGWLCLLAFGLNGQLAAPTAGLSLRYVAAGAVSVAATTMVLTAIKLPHPPAGASTLIVSLGIIATGPRIAAMASAVVAVTAMAWLVNLVLGTRPSPVGHPAGRAEQAG
ncbi:MAG: hypothetical protein JWN61_1355 [Pseudonocardiales bacterium]|nr:hypothetical protein [Pseudonocardiales bacterium]